MSSPMEPADTTASAQPKKRTRTRSGCLNCRRKKRKCDETRPTCATCVRRRERCEWGLKVTFRAENALAIDEHHPSMRRSARKRPPREFEILDVTSEVIRDCDLSSPLSGSDAGAADDDYDEPSATPIERAISRPVGVSGSTLGDSVPLRKEPSFRPPDPSPATAPGYLPARTATDEPSPSSLRSTENAVANLLYLSQSGPPPLATGPSHPLQPSLGAVPMDMIADYIEHVHPFTPEGGPSEDGVFLPGSAYHELHSTLRNHLIQEVRSNAPSRPPTPDNGELRPQQYDGTTDSQTEVEGPASVSGYTASTSTAPQGILTKEAEMVLWRNWFGEIAPWLDKFDQDRSFGQHIPTMAAANSHLRFSILALSARQIELKHHKTLPPTDRHSLTLYQEAIHLLLPHLPTRSTAVIASCVILCVLEMLSCSPKAWQRHLDGCAGLMEAVGINGYVGGLEEALFWCFARMDVCGGLISSVKTLIPISHWMPGISTEADVELFRSRATSDDFEFWSHYSVYLLAQVLDLLAPNPTTTFDVPNRTDPEFRTRWMKLWRHISDWHDLRPAALRPIMTVPSCDSSPFPAILFSNPAAMSGSQLYHTAAILMLQNQPPHSIRLLQAGTGNETDGRRKPPRSILWHARQVCAIAISNEHHGAWTNGIQPLWIAGRCMSHPAEHKAILSILDRIERESGWKTRWRADDLREFWGDLGE